MKKLFLIPKITFVLLVLALVWPGAAISRAADRLAVPGPLTPTVGYAVRQDRSRPLREMAAIPPALPETQTVQPALQLPKALRGAGETALLTDEALQSSPGDVEMPEPLTSFDGVTNVNGVLPPDTQGDIGYDPVSGNRYYVQWVNLSFAIWDVTGLPTLVYGPVSGNTLWQGFGGVCETTNHGDPITLYDTIAQRWIMSQFSVNGPYYQCVAVSQTADPLGPWYRYAFLVSATKMNDYPKFGVWPDGYYMTVNQFTNGQYWGGAGVFVFERDKMLLGQSASFVYFDLASVNMDFGGMLPSDLDGLELPPAGTPNYFLEVDDANWIGPQDAIRLWEFHVDWTNPANSTFGVNGQPNAVLPTAEFTPLCVSTRSCIPQPDTTARLDAIGDRLMYRLAYRNFGDHESLVVNHTVNVGGNQAGVRWYELRDPGGSPAIYQQGTYAPDSDHRWMGSVAMDYMGNMALGYSVSSSSVYPSVRYTGRLANDPLNTLPQAEVSLVAGAGHQTHTASRWGDYSMMGIDPLDDCTFWYTQEYYAVSSSAGWRTRIGSFRYPNCVINPPGTLQGKVTSTATGSGIPGALISVTGGGEGPFQTTTQTNGSYQIDLPSGTYTVTAGAYGYYPESRQDITVVSGETTSLNLALNPAEMIVVSGQVRDRQTGWPVYARLTMNGEPIGPPPGQDTAWSSPEDGGYSLSLPAGIDYTLQVEPLVPGYVGQSINLGVLSDDLVQDVELEVAQAACNATGYSIVTEGAGASFDAGLPAGWTLIDRLDSGVNWRFDDPGGRTNLTGGSGAFAILDSDYFKSFYADAVLQSPAYDLSALTTVLLEFKYDFRWYEYNLNEVADVDVSLDGGTAWTNVWRRSGAHDRGPKSARIDISTLAAGEPDVRVRFRYYNARYEWWWQVDDFFLGRYLCIPSSGGLVVGSVSDANTGLPLPGAQVESLSGEVVTTWLSDDPALPGAFYTIFSPPGEQTLTASFEGSGYGALSAAVQVPDGGVVLQDFALPAGMLQASPGSVELELIAGLTATETVAVTNNGGLDLHFEVLPVEGPAPLSEPTGPFAAPVRRTSPKELTALDAQSVRIFEPPQVAGWPAGRVLQSWNSQLAGAWGLAFEQDSGEVWVGSVGLRRGDERVHRFGSGGVPGGFSLDTSAWVGSYAADLAYDPVADRLWQVNVGGDNCLHSLNAAGTVDAPICPPFGAPARGLAYDPATRSFYAGSWVEQTLYHFDHQGRLLDSADTGLNIAGLAYNPSSGHLYVSSNADTGYDVYVLDVWDSYRILGGFDLPGMSDFGQSSLDLDCAGGLWAVDALSGQVSQIHVEEQAVCDWAEVAWLDVSPTSGDLAPAAGGSLALRLDASALPTGTYQAHLQFINDAPYGAVYVPVTLHVVPPSGLELAPETLSLSSDPGQEVQYELQARNGSLVTDSFTVEASGNDWPVDVPAVVGPLGAGEQAAFNVIVTVPATATCSAIDSVTVRLTSKNDPQTSAQAELTSQANAVYGVALSSEDAEAAGWPGEVVSYTVQLRNTGNCSDGFSLEADSPWLLQLPAQIGPLDGGSTESFSVPVQVPWDVNLDAADTLSLTAFSNGDAGQSAALDLLTTVLGRQIYLPIARR